MGGKRGDVDIVNVDCAVSGANDSADGMKQCGFADARWAGNRQRFASRHCERNVVDNDGVVEGDREIRNLKHDS